MNERNETVAQRRLTLLAPDSSDDDDVVFMRSSSGGKVSSEQNTACFRVNRPSDSDSDDYEDDDGVSAQVAGKRARVSADSDIQQTISLQQLPSEDDDPEVIIFKHVSVTGATFFRFCR